MNSGKSTLINAILGAEILPTSLTACTKRITVLRRSTDSRFRLLVNGCQPEVFDDMKQLKGRLPSIVGKGNGAASILEVTIEFAGCDLLELGLEIVDTPGYNENKNIREKSLEYMKQASVVAFVINSEDGCLVTENTNTLQDLYYADVFPLFLVN